MSNSAGNVAAPKQCAYLFIDEANLFGAARKKGWKIDWQRFLSHLRSMYDIRAAYLYEGMPTKRSILASNPTATQHDINTIKRKKKDRFKRLRSYGYVVRHKQVSTVNGDNKCNFDVEIAVDAIDLLADYDVFVLASGDGDFIRLVKYLRGKGKAVHIVGPKKSNKELKKEARGNFHSLAGMRSHVGKG